MRTSVALQKEGGRPRVQGRCSVAAAVAVAAALGVWLWRRGCPRCSTAVSAACKALGRVLGSAAAGPGVWLWLRGCSRCSTAESA
eukprot:scaffold105711_cov18-Tisochrysis_lutea.AAC.1